ncbi:unnamed protein product [Withania somnifera]
MEEITNNSHVLVLPFPLQGHINPMVQFSKRLASRGVKVTIVTINTVTNDMPKEFAIVEKLSDSEYPVKVLVSDSIITWAIDLAHQLGLKRGCIFCTIFKVPLDVSAVLLPSLPLLEKDDLPSLVYESDLYPNLAGLVFRKKIIFKNTDWLFFNTFDALEKEVIDWIRTQYTIKTIGPTIPSTYLDKRLKEDKEYGVSLFKPKGETCLNCLDSRETGSVVYVSFGSLASLGEQQMVVLTFGLMTSNCYFLWVVRATEENKLPEEFMSKVSEKGLIVSWRPQLDVLAHRAVGCFFTHCGWNSTLEALSLGVPLVGMPQWTDQPSNAKFISDVWKTGIRVKAGENGVVSREEIVNSIREVMEEEKGLMLKENAIKWKVCKNDSTNKLNQKKHYWFVMIGLLGT